MRSFLFSFPKIKFDIMNALCKEEMVLINVYELECCAVKDLLWSVWRHSLLVKSNAGSKDKRRFNSVGRGLKTCMGHDLYSDIYYKHSLKRHPGAEISKFRAPFEISKFHLLKHVMIILPNASNYKSKLKTSGLGKKCRNRSVQLVKPPFCLSSLDFLGLKIFGDFFFLSSWP